MYNNGPLLFLVKVINNIMLQNPSEHMSDQRGKQKRIICDLKSEQWSETIYNFKGLSLVW